MRFLCSIALATAVVFTASPLVAQQTSPSVKIQQATPARRNLSDIYPGQPLSETVALLRQHEIEFVEGGFAFAQGNPDTSHLSFYLDSDHTTTCVAFSRSKKNVTGIALVFFPSKESHDKGNESWLEVQRLTLHEDKSYSAHFAPPR